jgi:hypothetical protein
MKRQKNLKLNLMTLAMLTSLAGCSGIWKKEIKTVSDFCASYKRLPATDEMLEEVKKAGQKLSAWIADNEHTYEIKKCDK